MRHPTSEEIKAVSNIVHRQARLKLELEGAILSLQQACDAPPPSKLDLLKVKWTNAHGDELTESAE